MFSSWLVSFIEFINDDEIIWNVESPPGVYVDSILRVDISTLKIPIEMIILRRVK